MGAGLNFSGRVFIEPLDRGNLGRLNESQFLDRPESFRRKQLANDFVDVQRFHEDVRAFGEFLLAALRLLRFRQNIDVPAGKLRCQPDVLAAPPDC
jgi:hypothetical protein